MANYNLAGQKIKDTYTQVAQVSGSTLLNGSGTATPIATSSIVSFDTEVSRSAAAAGFGTPITPSLQAVTSVGASTSASITLTGVGTSLNGSGLATITNFAQIGGTIITGSWGKLSDVGLTTDLKAGVGQSGVRLVDATNVSYIQVGTNESSTNVPFTGSYIKATSGFVGNLTGTASFATSASHASTSTLSDFAASATSASYASTASYVAGLALPGLVAGDGTDGIKVSSNLVTYAAYADAEGVALGNATYAGGGDVAIGAEATGSGGSGNNVAIGSGAKATGGGSIAMVNTALASGTDSIAIGNGAYSSNTNTIAIGKGSQATGAGSLAIGIATASGADTIAIGESAIAESVGAISIGKNSEARGDYSVAIGYNSDVFDTVRDYATAVGAESRLAQNSTAIGYHAYGVGSDCIAIGMNSNAAGFGAVAVGVQAQAYANNAIAMGYQQQANNYNYEVNINGIYRYNHDNTSKANINSVLNLTAQDPLPTGGVGDLAVSGSGLYFHNGSTWSLIS